MSGARPVPAWDAYFLTIAEAVKLRSKDPSSQIGVVIVDPDNQIVATGYNGLPSGMREDDPILFERPTKYDYFIHAEENALLQAAKRGIAVKGCRIYLTGKHFTCYKCARMIAQAGITDVFAPEPNYDLVDYKFDVAMEIYRELGVRVHTRPITQ